MENLPLCRICLVTDVRMCSIASHLRDMYETITSMTFKREDGRPLKACYICHARLHNCYRLRTNCLRSEESLTEMISSSVFKPQDVFSGNSFGVMSVLHLSLGHELAASTECHVKEESLEVIYDTELKDIVTETQEELCTKIDDITQCPLADDPLDVIKREPDDVETDADVKLEIEGTILEENEAHVADLPLLSKDNMCPKIVLERIDLNDYRTSVPVVKKLAETDSHLKDNICKLTAARITHKTNYEVDATLPIRSDEKVMVHYECDSCTRTFKNRTSFRKHLYKHTGEKPYQCNVCNKFFSSKSSKTEHMRIHTENNLFHCDVCKKFFKSKRCLKQHMLYIHTKERQFHCDVCNKCFKIKHHLIQHINTHTDERRFHCDICNKCFKIKHHLTYHMYTHAVEKPFQCDVCNKCFKSKHCLTQHINTHERRFHCDVCSKCFIRKHHLTRHMGTHTGERRFHCDICNKCFKIKHHLTYHMSTHAVEKPFQCDVCNKCFKSKHCLTQHINTHTGERRFHCDVCNKSFFRKQNLKQHMDTHTGERRFHCDVCSKCFIRKHHLTLHMDTHTGERRFK